MCLGLEMMELCACSFAKTFKNLKRVQALCLVLVTVRSLGMWCGYFIVFIVDFGNTGALLIACGLINY